MSPALRLLRTSVLRHASPALCGPVTPRALIALRVPSLNSRFFGCTVRRRASGTSDHALSGALYEELKYEEESSDDRSVTPEFLQTFNEKGIWKIEEFPGRDDVTLTRKYGTEKIRVEFSVADLMNQQDDSEYDNYAEGERKDTEAEGEEEEDSFAPSLPVRVNVVLSKKESAGAVAIEASVQDGAFAIVGVSYFKDASLVSDGSAEADWKRRTLYLGPQYDRLEPSLQEKFDDFLKERGVGDELALFIPAFAEYKEQKEYVGWLQRLKDFIDY